MLLPDVIPNVAGELKRQAKVSQYVNDPVLWAKEYLGITLWSKQQEVAYSVRDNKSTAVKAGHGVGKATTLDTPLFTPNGWTTMGDIRVGDYVFDEQGQPTRVVAKSEVWHQEVFEVVFDDGSTVKVHPNHEWNVLDHKDVTSTVTTKVLSQSLENQYRVPVTKPLVMSDKPLPEAPFGQVPDDFLTSSERQRQELFTSLRAAGVFTKPLTENLHTLLVSLGYKVYVDAEGIASFTLGGFRTIVEVNKIADAPTQCIQVDSPSHLFLAGRDMVPTHNSLLAAVLIAWWIDVHPLGSAYFFTTAPSNAQVTAVIGRELRNLLTLSRQRYKDKLIDHPLPGRIISPNTWKTDEGDELGAGRKPPDYTTEDTVQGLHGKYLLAVGDEACGLSESMIDSLSNITSNDNSRRLLIGNPTNPASHFAKIFKENTGAWSLHTISVMDSPNFTDEKNSMDEEALEKLTGPSYVEDKKKEYGEDSARYRARILGEFAFDIGDTLIDEPTVAVAVDTEIIPSVETRPVLGVDVARFGDDLSVVYSMHDGQLRYVDSWEKAPTTETANRVHRLALELGVSEVRVDAVGIGGGVVDQLVQLSQDRYVVIEMIGGGASPDKRQWYNARAFWWDRMRDMMRNGAIDMDPDDSRLSEELLMVEYKFANNGALLIESKDDMRKRKVKSPDFADAAIYASADLSAIVAQADNPLVVGERVSYDLYDFTPREVWETALNW